MQWLASRRPLYYVDNDGFTREARELFGDR